MPIPQKDVVLWNTQAWADQAVKITVFIVLLRQEEDSSQVGGSGLPCLEGLACVPAWTADLLDYKISIRNVEYKSRQMAVRQGSQAAHSVNLSIQCSNTMVKCIIFGQKCMHRQHNRHRLMGTTGVMSRQ